jgi:hypothetical protein
MLNIFNFIIESISSDAKISLNNSLSHFYFQFPPLFQHNQWKTLILLFFPHSHFFTFPAQSIEIHYFSLAFAVSHPLRFSLSPIPFVVVFLADFSSSLLIVLLGSCRQTIFLLHFAVRSTSKLQENSFKNLTVLAKAKDKAGCFATPDFCVIAWV